MNSFIKNSIRFALFLLVQVVVLKEVPPIHQYITPYLYFIFILWMPFGTSRLSITLLGFLIGFILDLFSSTPGLHAAACGLMAYVRPSILNLLLAQETSEEINKEPSVATMGWGPYIVYTLVITFIHHFYLVLLEWLQFGSFGYFIGKVTATSLMSVLLIILVELIMNRRKQNR